MPGWHNATQKLRAAGDLQMVGIVLEQHPARTRLFMQWKQMDWPVMVDPLNLLGLEVVPVTLLIDEQGVVRFRGDLAHLETFLALEPTGPVAEPRPVSRPSISKDDPATSSPDSERRRADALFLWGSTEDLDEAIDLYSGLLVGDPAHGPTHFRLGVAYRQRYDSGRRHQGDFQNAVAHWGKALDLDPNQYIWRRRIQQYGPRLAKPYPFYDWVEAARQEILARGETPTALPVEPRGAEIASPSKSFTSDARDGSASPDPEGRIHRDEKGFVRVEQTVVPATLEPGASGRVHLVFRPEASISAHWNNEAEDMMVWVDPPPGWQVDRRALSVPNPAELVSSETRRMELEVQAPKTVDGNGGVVIPAYALYYVCEDVRGTCLYRRQDLDLRIDVAAN